MAAWACGDACAKGRADEQAAYALRTLSNAAPRGFAAREASDVAWALAAARERLLPPAATDNAVHLATSHGQYCRRIITPCSGWLWAITAPNRSA